MTLSERGWPVAVSAEGTSRTVASIGEIWRVDDEWWRAPLQRRYFDVLFEGGKHAILYEDELTHQWFEQRP